MPRLGSPTTQVSLTHDDRSVGLLIRCAAVHSSRWQSAWGWARGQHPEVAGTAAYPPFEVYLPEVDLPVDDDEYPYLLLADPRAGDIPGLLAIRP